MRQLAQYTYVWKADKSWGGTCQQLIVQSTDGTNHVSNFQFNPDFRFKVAKPDVYDLQP